MGQRWKLDSETSVANFGAFVSQQRLAGQSVTVEFITPSRSIPQNALINTLYGQIAQQKGDESRDEIRAYCKYHFGLGIVCAGDPDYAKTIKAAIRPDLDYETKMAIVEILPITSRMNKTQGSEYIDRVIRHYSQQGLCLAHPSELA